MRSTRIALFVALAGCAIAQTAPTPQIQKAWELEHRVAEDLEKKDGAVTNPDSVAYAQQLADKLAGAAAVRPVQVHLTRGIDQYVTLRADRSLYLSTGILNRIED